jgi:hypothetical protein
VAYKAEKRLYVNADRSKVVEEDSGEAVFLLAAEGAELTDEEVKRYGLGAPKRAVPRAAEPEDKAEDAPATKAVQPKANKGAG